MAKKTWPKASDEERKKFNKVNAPANAAELKLRLGLAQRDRNEGARLGFAYLMRRLRKLSKQGMTQFSIEDIAGEIAEIREISAARPKGLGREKARKPKGKK
jgi:hypothetical protein